MRVSTIEEGKRCPKCGSDKMQANAGTTRSGTRRCRCHWCKYRYTLNPKSRAYPEELRQKAIKEFMMGTSGRGVGKINGMSGNNVYNWIKKNSGCVDK